MDAWCMQCSLKSSRMEKGIQAQVLIFAAVWMLSLVPCGCAKVCSEVGLEDGNAVHLTPNCFTPYPEVVFTADDSNNFHNTVTIEYICTDNSGSVVAADVLRTSVDAPTSIITIPQPFTAGTQCTFSGCYVSMTILSYTGISYAIRPTSCTVDTNECDLGTHNCNRNARCTNTIGSFECHCYPGYEGNGIECTELRSSLLHLLSPTSSATLTSKQTGSECVVIISTSGAVATTVTFMTFLTLAVVICILVARVRIKRSQDVQEVNMDKIDPDYNPVEIEETIINAESMQSIFDRLELENQEGNHPNGDEDSIEIEMNVSVEDEAAAFKEERAHASEVVIPSESDAILRGYVAETSASVEIPTSTIDAVIGPTTTDEGIENPGHCASLEAMSDDFSERVLCHVSTSNLNEGDPQVMLPRSLKRSHSTDSNLEHLTRSSSSENEPHPSNICNGYLHTLELTDFVTSATPSAESKHCVFKSNGSHFLIRVNEIQLSLQQQNDSVPLAYISLPSDLHDGQRNELQAIGGIEKHVTKQLPATQPGFPSPNMMYDSGYICSEEFSKEQTKVSRADALGNYPKNSCTSQNADIDSSKCLSCNTEKA